MDEIELTQLFVEYAECNKKMAELKHKIEMAILERGETVKIAGVTASYYKPAFEKPDYEAAAKTFMPPDFDLAPFSTVTTSVRWKDVCEALSIVASPSEEKPARVVVKV